MTDLELLELAAKAAGYQIEWVRNSGCHYRCEAEESREQWCPLDDDGDALRLAVKLDISLIGDFPQNIVVVAFDARRIIEKYDGDQYAATRRAIVRAAAAIGSSM